MLSAELRVEPGSSRLRLQRAAGCPGCSQAGGCGSAVMAASAKPLTLPLPDDCRVSDGDTIRAELQPAALLQVCLLIFLPLSFLTVGGAWAATALPLAPDLAALAGAAVGLTVGCALLKRYDSRFGSRWLRRRRWVMPSGMDAKRAS